MKVVDWIRIGTSSLAAVAAVMIAIVVDLDRRASKCESRIHDEKLARIESAVTEKSTNIAVRNKQVMTLFERQDEVLDRLDNAEAEAL